MQPASLDLRLGAVAYRVRASFLPRPGSRVQTKLDDLALHTISLSQGAVLETGCVYIVPLLERLALPAFVEASANPKSSTGRLDVFTRVIADGVGAFDQIPHGYAGPLYAEICPQTSRSSCARDRACRRSAFASATPPTPTPCYVSCRRASIWSPTPTPTSRAASR